MSEARRRDVDLLVKVSRLFYVDGLTQLAIAERLRISRFRVARALEEALERGIVTITIQEQGSTVAGLEYELERTFGLRRAIVAESQGQDDVVIKRVLGRVAAAHLEDVLADGDFLGVSWGTTIKEVAAALQPQRHLDIHVVQITGGLNQVAVNVNAPEVTRRVAEAFRGQCHLLHVPAILDQPSVRDALLEDGSVRHTVQLFNRITVALVGIGALAPKATSTLVRAGYIGERELASFSANHVVGDIFTHFFDIHGNICDCGLASRLIAMSVEQIRRVPYVVGVAGGRDKVQAILGALRGKLVNVLVTDEDSARSILELNAAPSGAQTTDQVETAEDGSRLHGLPARPRD